MLNVLGALAPSAGVGFLFWLAMRAMLRADRRERAAIAQFDREAAERGAASKAIQRDEVPTDGPSGDVIGPPPGGGDETEPRTREPDTPPIRS